MLRSLSKSEISFIIANHDKLNQSDIGFKIGRVRQTVATFMKRNDLTVARRRKKNRLWLADVQEVQIQVVDIDLVKRLRLEGRHAEAFELLEAFKRNNELQKLRDAKELLNRDNGILRFLAKKNGLCAQIGGRSICDKMVIEGEQFCLHHKEMRHRAMIKFQTKRRQKNVC